jgi:prolipoprotein diacylglyceryl transferase
MGGDWDLVLRVAVWGVAAGVVGARLYHDVTSWSEVPDPKWRGIFAVWEGGLGVWGGILFGCLAGAVVIHRSGESVARFLDAAAPGLLLAQGIGRLGNWWNQELFGKPTDRPWALEIDPEHRPLEYFDSPTFHPTFLYELAWDVAGVVLLLLLARRFRFRPPALFALYISYYCFGRFFEELLRIDPAHEIGPLRLNAWVSIVVFVLSTAFFIWWQFLRRERRERGDRPRPAPRGPKMAIPKGRVRQRG